VCASLVCARGRAREACKQALHRHRLQPEGQPTPPASTHVRWQHSAAQHSTTQHSTAQHSTAQHSTAQHSTAQHSAVRSPTAQRRAEQHSKALYSTAQISAAQRRPTCRNTSASAALLKRTPQLTSAPRERRAFGGATGRSSRPCAWRHSAAPEPRVRVCGGAWWVRWVWHGGRSVVLAHMRACTAPELRACTGRRVRGAARSRTCGCAQAPAQHLLAGRPHLRVACVCVCDTHMHAWVCDTACACKRRTRRWCCQACSPQTSL
jgi:hypothetical protein